MSIAEFFTEVKAPRVAQLGGKGNSLVILMNSGFNVPPGFILFSEVLFEFLRQNNIEQKIEKLAKGINEDNFLSESKKIRDLILNGKIPFSVASEISRNLKRLNEKYVAVRSSAISEDNLQASFAGLYDTFLNVKVDLEVILEHIKLCWASLFSERAVIYKLMKKISQIEGMSIIVQKMIPSEVSGITFTIHPVNKRAMLVELVQGIGDKLVSGRVTPQSFSIDRETCLIIEKKKSAKMIISEEYLRKIANLCLMVERTFGIPQDIEWCIYKDAIWLLQSRPITIVKLFCKGEHQKRVVLVGLGASPGTVRGKVEVILSLKEISKMNDGEILVTVMTNPLYITAIQKAKAIVTDVGGMICHAAIVARELGIPCVVGTENATKVLKDGMEIIVNGAEGKIYLPS